MYNLVLLRTCPNRQIHRNISEFDLKLICSKFEGFDGSQIFSCFERISLLFTVYIVKSGESSKGSFCKAGWGAKFLPVIEGSKKSLVSALDSCYKDGSNSYMWEFSSALPLT